MRRADLSGAVGVDLEPVARRELGEHGRLEVGPLLERGELVEVVLEPAGNDDLEDPGRLVAGVSEGVPLLISALSMPCK